VISTTVGTASSCSAALRARTSFSVLDELTSAGGSGCSPQAVVEMKSATTQANHFPATEGKISEVQAAESASQTDTPDDIAKAS
jgi:hypothetical protein